MAKFKLTPISEELDDPLWSQSQPPHEACYAGATSERAARQHAANYFREVSEIGRRGEKINPNSPWLDPRLTECTSIAEIAGDPMPDGWVYRGSESG